MKAVIYSRVSTADQETANQVIHLEGWSKARGFDLVEVYRENDTAWKDGHQKELQRLFIDAQKRRFDVVLVWSLDRLTREGALAILTLVNKLSRLGVRLYSYQEPWTEAPGELAELLFALSGWVARMESNRRSERTKAGIERKRQEGWKPGRPKGKNIKTTSRPLLHCKYCGYAWIARQPGTPKVCPKCKNYTDKEPKRRKGIK